MKFIGDVKSDLSKLRQSNKDEYYHVLSFLVTDALLILIMTYVTIKCISVLSFIFWLVISLFGFCVGYVYFGARYNYIDVDRFSDELYKRLPYGVVNWL